MSVIDIAHKGLWLSSKAKTEPFIFNGNDLCPTDWGQDDHRSNVALAYRNRERADQFYDLDTDRLILCAHALMHYAELCRTVIGNSAALAAAREELDALRADLLAANKEGKQNKKIVHALWHALDNGIGQKDGSVLIDAEDYKKLDKLLPEEHGRYT